MTEGGGLSILRMPDLAEADGAGMLPAAAAAGAQVRSVLAAAADLPEMDRPRAMVVVGADVADDVAFLTALVGRTAPAPIVAATTLPPWVGALDLVVVLARRRDDEPAAEAAAIARRRGATVVVRGAEVGPVGEAAGPSLLQPAVSVPESLAVSARWSLLTTIATRAGLAPAVDLSRTADLLDAIAVACHPTAENFVNAGVNLAEYLGAGTPMLIGSDLLADAIARHGARVLADLGGVAASVLTSAQAGDSPALLRRSAAPKDVFADPYDDGDQALQTVRPLLISTTIQDPDGATGASIAGPGGGDSVQAAADRRMLTGLLRSFPSAMHLDGSADALPGVSGQPEWSSEPDPNSYRHVRELVTARSGGPADAFDAAVAACVRLDFAAVYVGMATGQVVPLDFPDGLGRNGGSHWATRPAAVGSRWKESRS